MAYHKTFLKLMIIHGEEERKNNNNVYAQQDNPCKISFICLFEKSSRFLCSLLNEEIYITNKNKTYTKKKK